MRSSVKDPVQLNLEKLGDASTWVHVPDYHECRQTVQHMA